MDVQVPVPVHLQYNNQQANVISAHVYNYNTIMQIVLYLIDFVVPEMLPAMNSTKGMTSTTLQPAEKTSVIYQW